MTMLICRSISHPIYRSRGAQNTHGPFLLLEIKMEQFPAIGNYNIDQTVFTKMFKTEKGSGF